MALFIIIGVIVVLVVLTAFVSVQQEKKRRTALRELAQAMKLTFAERDDDLPASLKDFHLFSQGRARRASNVMNGRLNDMDVTIMDYRYTTGSGKHSHTWNQTVAVFRSGRLRLPAFALRPEHLFHRIGGVFGYQDIDFPAHPVFSSQYLLRGEDEQAIRELFGDDVPAYYEQHKGLSAEGKGDGLIFYRASKRVAPDQLRSFMEEAFGAFGLLKMDK